MQEGLDIGPTQSFGVVPIDPDRLKPHCELAQVIPVRPDRLGREILPLKGCDE
jgi:hypothetical protein